MFFLFFLSCYSFCASSLNVVVLPLSFLDASSHLYKKVCSSDRLLVGVTVTPLLISLGWPLTVLHFMFLFVLFIFPYSHFNTESVVPVEPVPKANRSRSSRGPVRTRGKPSVSWRWCRKPAKILLRKCKIWSTGCSGVSKLTKNNARKKTNNLPKSSW